MKYFVKIRNVLGGVGCCLVVGSASAISLGPSRGSAILGAPVDLTFDMQPEPGDDVASSCVTAGVAFGDTPVADARVRVSALPASPGRSPAVRVQTVGMVNEPVITVSLSAGCSRKVTRTYTFLADLPVTPVPGRPVQLDLLGAVSPSVTARDAGTGTGADRTAQPTAARRSAQVPAEPREQGDKPVRAAPRPQAARPAGVAAPRSPQVVARKAPVREERPAKAVTLPARPERSRLVMEPLDALAEPAVALRPSADMGAVPAQTAASGRLEAAAAWKALSMPRDAEQPDEGRVRALEAEMAALRAKFSAERDSVGALQQRLELIESQRYSAGLVYALMASLALALGLLAWVWQRARRDSQLAVQVWRDSVAVSAIHGGAGVEDPHALRPHPQDHWSPEDSVPFAQDTVVQPPMQPPVSTGLAEAASPERVQQPAPVAEVGSGVESSSHIVNPEDLFDIQQQAEFFVSVGEHDQAVGVLKKHIAAHRETSPSAYLELLRLYHALGRSMDFAQLRTQFSKHFNAQVPEFAVFSRQGRTLEHYVDALAAIEADWTSSSVVQLLEKLLFRRDSEVQIAPFDLAAFDDLLLLLAIAQTTLPSSRGAPPPRLRTTPLASLQSSEVPELPRREPSVLVPIVDSPPLSVMDSLEFEFSPRAPVSGVVGDAVAPSRGPLDTPDLDLDLSDPPHITLSDLPPVPATEAPQPYQPVGFGAESDRVEVRHELEQGKPLSKG